MSQKVISILLSVVSLLSWAGGAVLAQEVLEWEKRYPHDRHEGEGVAVTTDGSGNVYVLGHTEWYTEPSTILVYKFTPAGVLDLSFGERGIRTYKHNNGLDSASALGIAVDAAGNIYVTGRAWRSETVNELLVLKFTSTGALDPTFSGDGVLTYAGGRGSDITVDSSSNVYVAGSLNSNVLVLKYRSDGTPDTSFSGDGVQTYDGGTIEGGTGIALDGAGKIVVAGTRGNGSPNDALILRYTPAGDLDTTFNGTGIQTHAGNGGFDVAIDGSGRICVAGSSWNGTNSDVLVLRYTPAGILDTTFSGDGVQTYDGGYTDFGAGIAVDTSGSIYATRTFYTTSYGYPRQSTLLKYTGDGTLDAASNKNPWDNWATGIAVDSSGFIYTSGWDWEVSCFKYNPDGTMNKILLAPYDYAGGYAIAVDGSGSVYVTGYDYRDTVTGEVQELFVKKYTSAGVPDTTFNGNGVQTYAVGWCSGYGITVDGDGNVYVVGETDNAILILKYTAAGALDATFSGDGVQTYVGSWAAGRGIVLDSSGNIYVAGSYWNGSNYDGLVLKYTPAGVLDPTFSGDGIQTYDSGQNDRVWGIALDPWGNICLSGNRGNSSSDYSVFVLRYLPSGLLDTGFSDDGVQTYGSGQLYAWGMAVDTAGNIYITGAVHSGATWDALILKYTFSGALDPTFSGDGVQIFDGGGSENGAAIAVNSSGQVLVTGSAGDGVLILKYTPAGELDSAFHDDGVAIVRGGTYYEAGYAIAVGSNAFYVAGSWGDEISAWTLKFSTPTAAPSAPTGLAVVSATVSRIGLVWNDASNNEQGSAIERGTDGVNFTEIARVATNTGYFANSGLAAATTYYYRIRAYNAVGYSPYSGNASGTTGNTAPDKPLRPAGIVEAIAGVPASYSSSATDGDGHQVKLVFDWGDSTTDTTGYFASGSVIGGSHTWSAPGVYSVRVQAIDIANAVSVWSDSLSVSVIAPLSGIVSGWSGNGTSNDGTGSNHGTLYNGASYASGKIGQSFYLDGVDDYVSAGSASALRITNVGTIAAWIYPTGSSLNGGMIVSKEGEYLIARFGDGTIRWAFANSNPGWAWVNTGYVASLNQWTHVAVVYDNGAIRTYANGTLVHTYSGSGSVGDRWPGADDFRIGGRQLDSQYFKGLIDEVKMFSRALTAAEIQMLFDEGNTAPPPSFTSTWTGDGNANDSTGGNHGTMQGGAAYGVGKIGQAFNLDGVNDYAQMGGAASLMIIDTGTIAAWVYPTGSNLNGAMIVSKEGEYLIARFGDGTIRWAFANTIPGWAWVNTGYVAGLNQWTHIVIVYDNGMIRTHANGILVHSYSGSGSVGDRWPGTDDFRIGGRQLDNQYFMGRIDEVKMYSRALTAAEVQTFFDQENTAPPPSYTSYWAGDGNANDATGGNHGTMQGGAVFAAGRVNQAFSLDGVDDYVQMGSPASLTIVNTGTIAAWVYPTGSNINGGTIVSKEGEYLIARFGDGTIRWAFANTVPGWAWVNTGYVASLNQWTHVAVVYDNGVIRTYANGNPVHTYSGSGNVGDRWTEANDFRIGGRQLDSQYFRGLIDEVRFYNRVLSAAEIQALAQ